jgi:hypothetical protein
MRDAASAATGRILPLLVACGSLLPGCPLSDEYYVRKDDPGGRGASAGTDTGGAYEVSISGRGGESGAGGMASAGTPGAAGSVASAGAGGDDGSTRGCVSATNDRREYTFCFSPLIQANARTHCGDLEMTLAVIEDRAEDDWIATTFAELYQGDGTYAFIGANDVATEGEWRRADGVTFWRGGADGAAVSGNYANWAAGQPSDPGTADSEDCLTIGLADGAWNDMSCDTELPYVCEQR